MYLLTYAYVDGIVERRQPHREAHLAHIEKWSSDGPLAMAGATGDPPTGGLFVFETTDVAEVEAFTATDPYRQAELITATRIEPWKLVAHRELSDPMA